MTQTTEIPVEAILRDELAHGDAVLGTIAPILGHLVISQDNSLFSDEIIAQIRGMSESVAKQLLAEQAKVAGEQSIVDFIQRKQAELAADLMSSPEFLSHCHALTVERQLVEKLHRRSAVDPVLSPMLQALISSDDAAISSAAMAALAAQARFIQQQQRMELPVCELPGELFHAVVLIWRTTAEAGDEDVTARAEMQLRSIYDEGVSRLGLMSKLVAGMGQGARAALSVSHAGVALFVTALAYGSRQDRDIAVLSTNERQLGRFALGLRASGLKPQEVEEQFLMVHPEIAMPEGFELLRSERAAEMLATTDSRNAG
ncbi:hypothetical protein [Pontixanthobacter gangjinensis]|uniref:Uncharacterized protein n=1 Tax=Pontixanthobacter gangjinensis TaxID=1028742 RepID=A0A6I4SQ02_9SPHN|nr:hypothetical protein [Pontixanthobacter gangjinensis]MXO56917.1 hypothetical protein [Pontixanthobacter gangjinensis]